MFRPCIVIPVYEHAEPLKTVLAKLLPGGLACVVVDDGSGEACRRALAALAGEHHAQVTLAVLERNGGKGAAVKAGLRRAAGMGFTHALQVDADGQHDLDALPALLAAAEREPEAVICGLPVFDASVPAARLYGRRLTNFWIKVNTLSGSVPDGMCGLRVYPLAATVRVLDGARTGNRMDFDPEVLVRLKWAGLALRFLPVAVHYPQGGVSHFRLGRDNLLISWMHTRLFFGMLRRLFPLLRAGT
ncbi:MAG TPA: glycosyltransferase family 2 protein [Fibrobacteria bacterium]|nr:glycosyltransferase family 2 protein [Fibrobacteria bacterium]